jgi:hypothetical protein
MYEPSPYRQRQPSNYQRSGGGARQMIVLCIRWTVFAPVPDSIDDLVVGPFPAEAAASPPAEQLSIAAVH